MMYYIEISSWNLLESFVTESISPFSFYQERDFGNNLSRYLSGNKERNNHLVLSTKDLGGDYTVCVDATLLDESVLEPVKGLSSVFIYPKTIYYRQGLVHFRFNTKELIDSLIAESQILLEVKCLEKYLSTFYVKQIDNIERKGLSKLGNTISFNMQAFIDSDNTINRIKGALIGYVRGIYTSTDETTQMLQNELRALKNHFGGYYTQIMMSDVFVKNDEIEPQIGKCRIIYSTQIEQSNSFDVLSAQFKEIENLANMRAEENSPQKATDEDRDILLKEKTSIENRLVEIENKYNIYGVKCELNDIKNKEKANGEVVGKSRLYFKKGTAEYERKCYLKKMISDFEQSNSEYSSLKDRLSQIDKNLKIEVNNYDATLSVLFSRVSDILNDLINKSSKVTSNSTIDLANIVFDAKGMSVKNPEQDAEISFCNILLRQVLDKTTGVQLSEYAVLQILADSVIQFKKERCSNSSKGEAIVNTLRSFWRYKKQETDMLEFPNNDMPVLQSIFSFLVKPLNYDQIERFMLLRHCTQKAYAFMIWGAWIGFAGLPKTFTNVLYQNDDVTRLIDNKLKELNKI